MDSTPGTRLVGGRDRRRRRAAGIMLAAGLVLAVAAIPILQSPVSAAQKLCPDGSPPPCDVDPDPDPTTTPPSTTPPPPVWTAHVSILDQSAGGYNPTVWGGFVTTGSPTYATPAGYVGWADATARNEGTLGLTSTYLPAAPALGFYARSLSDDGMICRSPAYGSVPASGRQINILLAPTIDKSAMEINDLVQTLLGRVSPDPAGAEVTVQSASLVPDSGGLLLDVSGRVKKDVGAGFHYFGNFHYVVLLHVSYSIRTGNPHEVLTVHADEGDLTLHGDSAKDDALHALGDNPEPDFRSAVQSAAMNKMNDNVAQNPKVAWFASLGYTVSVRKVTTDAAGLHVVPSLCKVS